MPPRGAPTTTNARRLRGRAIGDLSGIADGDRLAWNAGAGEFQPASGSGGAAALGVGMVVGVAYATADGDPAPTGTLWCEGQDVSRTTYAELFAAVGTTWGAGDGSSTFSLPDLRGRTLLGRSSAGSPTQVGTTGGSRDATLVSHSHGISDGSNQLARGNGSAAAGPFVQGNDGVAATSYSTDSQGSSATDANLPPYAGVRWAIVAQSASYAQGYASLSRSTTQSIPNATSEPVDWEAESSDGVTIDLGTDPDRVTFTRDGTWLVSAQGTWAANSTGYRRLQCYLYDSADVFKAAIVSDYPTSFAAPNQHPLQSTGIFRVSAGDYMRVVAVHNSGAALNLEAGARLELVEVLR